MFIIKVNNDNIIGVYDNIDAALNTVYSISDILENQTVNILKYKINSGIILENYDIDLNYKITIDKKINYNNQEIYTNYNDISNNYTNYNDISNNILSEYQDDSENNTSVITDDISDNSTDNTIKQNKIKELFNITQEKNNLNQEKINIIHDLNLLKEKQKKQQEDENIYNNDLDLYYKFKKLKDTDTTFIIPIMFEEKFKIFEKLKNNISYENFKKEYNPEKMKTSYADLFESEENSDDIISCEESVFCDAEVIDLNNALNKNNI